MFKDFLWRKAWFVTSKLLSTEPNGPCNHRKQFQFTRQLFDYTQSNYISLCKRFCLFYKKNLLFLFYTITFTKHLHQFIYYTHFFIKIIFSLNFFIISHLTLFFPLNTPPSSSHNPYLYLRLSVFSFFLFFFFFFFFF